jgi:proteasome lid subunit RPN8/RPN11
MTTTTLKITQNDWEAVLAHLKSVYPAEGCGLLAGKNGRVHHIYPVDNALASPQAFEMVPEQLVKAMIDIEEQGFSLLGIYHSHPQGPPFPSPTDIAQANYPETVQVIVSLQDQTRPETGAFQIINNRVNLARLEIV